MLMSMKQKISNIIREHTSWKYTDNDGDQIKCECGWISQGFTPRTDAQAKIIFADHIAEKVLVIIEN